MLLILLIALFIYMYVSSAMVMDQNYLDDHFAPITREYGFGIQRLKYYNKDNHVDEEDVHSLSLSLSASEASTDPTCVNVTTNYFPAIIDNFAPISTQRVWYGKGQRYWMNNELWGGQSYPIFVYIGGEWEESCRTLTPGHRYFYDLAIEHHALLVNVEHRFYGDSFPFEDTSTENLKYLSALQGIADLARLLQYIVEENNATESKVITFGGSYAGNLAAWFRLKYPHVTDGSVASCAPLTAKVNFFEYMEVVDDAMLYYSGTECTSAFTNAAEEIALLGSGEPGSSGYQQLETLFHTCTPMNSKKDLSILLSNLMGNIQGTVQYNKRRSTRMNVTDICETMLNVTSETQSDLDRFVILAGKYRAMYGVECEDVSWEGTIAYLSNTTNDGNNNNRPWTYQTCNEFGYYQTTDSLHQPFSSWFQLNMSFYRNICYEAFDGWQSSPQTEWINSLYGGVNIAATNIIFPAGSIDPWHVLGIYDETKELWDSSLESLYITGTAHCHDMSVPWHTDIAALTAAREVIATTVSAWVSGPVNNDDDNENDTPKFFIFIFFGVLGLFVSAGIYRGIVNKMPSSYISAEENVEMTTNNVLQD